MEVAFMAMEALTVSQLTRRIRSLLEASFGEVWVEGEISNLRVQSSGHQYFTLKDESAQVSCVLFRGSAVRLPMPLRDGLQVRVFGEVTVYEQRGNYQIIVREVQPKGLGSLQARFEALKLKLKEEGLFDAEWKKPIPRHPRCVALVTSPTGAAVRDMLNILERRSPWLHVMVFPVRVQGQGAELEIVQALEVLNRAEEYGLPTPDTIVVGRGGGSLEDLWCFNEEVLARAIYASEIPVVSAVGHEIDFTIADFVADLRAPTPSAAAELLAPDGAEMQRHFEALGRRMRTRMETVLERQEREIELLGRGALMREPERLLREAAQQVDDQEAALKSAMEMSWRGFSETLLERRMVLERHRPEQLLAQAEHRLAFLRQRAETAMRQRVEQVADQYRSIRKLLKSLGPDAVLARGFSVTTDGRGVLVADPAVLRPGDMVVTKLAKGSFSSVVTKQK
jgi:exodeoxyribonuclease VII large subunit